jgi:hypothetical protein
LGSGVDESVSAVAVAGADVYVGGLFHYAGENPVADHIARWDGTAWHALGSGVNLSVRAVAVVASDVYVGGEFQSVGTNRNYIARWGEGYHVHLPLIVRQ